MRGTMLGLGLALMVLPTVAMAQMGPGGGGGGFPGGGGGGGGRHGGGGGGSELQQSSNSAPQSREIRIKRDRFEKAVEALFREADLNHDGIVTPDEVHQVLDAKRDAIIRARFERIDTNHDKLIQPDEFLAWQRRLGNAAADADDDDDAAAGGGTAAPGNVEAPAKNAIEDRLIQRIIGPLDAVAITRANTNYDAGASLEELQIYERTKFDAVDTDHDGEITGDELRAAGIDSGRKPGGGGGGGRTGGGFSGAGGGGRRGRGGQGGGGGAQPSGD